MNELIQPHSVVDYVILTDRADSRSAAIEKLRQNVLILLKRGYVLFGTPSFDIHYIEDCDSQYIYHQAMVKLKDIMD